jgi:curli production assembly/transport component CsgF
MVQEETTDMGRVVFGVACVLGIVALLSPALATEMVYHPVSPTFGGNPDNGAFLLSTAQAQGEGVNSGNQGPNLSGLTAALNNMTVANPTANAAANPTVNAATVNALKQGVMP